MNSPENINFLKEHYDIINKKSYVWFCRFGKSNVSASKIKSQDNYIFLKDSKRNGNKIYIVKYETIASSPDNEVFPKYYDRIKIFMA